MTEAQAEVAEDDELDVLEEGVESSPDLPIHAMPTQPTVASLDELAGIDEIKVELREQIRLWADPEPLRRLGGVPRIGFIFAGPTGTGKTTAAHALAAETGRDLYTFAGPDFADSNGHVLLTTVLTAMSKQAVVVFIDEADDLLHRRNFRRERSMSLVKHLLVGLDRTTREIRSFFVLATNLEVPDIDPALCHPGRLGRPILFRGLATRERRDMLVAAARQFAVAPDANLGVIADQLGGVPTATVAHVLDEAAFVAATRGHAEIGKSDLQEAVARLRVGLARTRPWDAEELRRTALHEAGHAVVAIALARSWDAVPWVQVDARADGNLGITDSAETGQPITEIELHHRLAVALAGRAAEVLAAGGADAGSAADLNAAMGIAVHAARNWGMTSRGLRTSSEFVEAIIEADVDAAAGELLVAADAVAVATLEAHRPALDALTERLVLHRAGSSEDVARWLGGLLPIDTSEVER
jgi:cell division protease FtsH